VKILLATLHAKYVHASLALPCLAAACGGMNGVTAVTCEFTVNEPADRVLRLLVAAEANVAAFSCYIWNIEETLKLASDLKRVRPETFIILGGPEASYGVFELMERQPAIDCVVRGEGEETFREVITFLRDELHRGTDLSGLADIPGLACRVGEDIVATSERAPVADLNLLPSPFAAGLVDLEKPLVYYETSRGCPFSCAFCMSSLEQGVRSFSTERIKSDLGLLMEREVQTVKLVDRTFNYDAARADSIWKLILAGNRASRFHFEIAADLLTEENFRLLRKVPAGIFRFEIGVQSGEDETLARVGRKSDLVRLFANVRRLREETGVVVHLDLVAGLPGEDFPGFLRSLQKVFDVLDLSNSYFFDCQGGKEETTGAYETVRRGVSDEANAGRRKKTDCFIQVEPLKVLKGSPMRKIAAEENYAFSAAPPYKILRTPWLSFVEICRIETISRLVDLIHNSGKFRTTLAHIERTLPLSRFFTAAAEYWEDTSMAHNLSLHALFEAVWQFAGEFTPEDEREEFRDALCFDFCLADYPVAGRLPGFFAGAGSRAAQGKGREETAALAQRFGVAAGSRVRSFSRTFAKDHSSATREGGPVDFLFVYISAPGRGLEVKVVRR
jgi:anaerobic magnesium-protoporphyrin IX monomethyl ester cyclase